MDEETELDFPAKQGHITNSTVNTNQVCLCPPIVQAQKENIRTEFKPGIAKHFCVQTITEKYPQPFFSISTNATILCQITGHL